ncbi:hypothetical protein PSY53_23865, partial [Shigella flexneri]|nr:hypothetical protein [Shigella flexneri]
AQTPVLKLRKWLNPVSLVPGWQCEGSALLSRRIQPFAQFQQWRKRLC